MVITPKTVPFSWTSNKGKCLSRVNMTSLFVSPDMIGGGEYSYFYNNPDKPLDQELIVRSAQCSALMPMMQFSVAPWRVLSKENMNICRDMALLHEKMGPEILEMAKDSAKSGEPVVRHMEYMYPHKGYAEIKDQFLPAHCNTKSQKLKKEKIQKMK